MILAKDRESMISNEEYFFYESGCDLNEEDIFGCVNQIFPKIDDEVSKLIFSNRLMYSMTQSNEFLNPVVQSNPYGKMVLDYVSRIKAPIYIYGAGRRGRRIPFLYPSKYYKGYIDNNREGKLNDLEIINLNSIDSINGYRDAYYFISNETEVEEIERVLSDKGILSDHIFALNKWYLEASKDIYFNERCLAGVDKEKTNTFGDIGAFHGETSLEFVKWRGSNDARIIAFEPMHENFLVCLDELKEFKNAQVINAASSNAEDSAVISVDSLRSSIMKEDDELRPSEKIICVVADRILKNETVNYIKMDVEGYEERALHGLVATIKRCHPLMAISVYHKREDIWRIPKQVLDISPNYTFRFGHHTLGIADTVLYAIPNVN